MRLRRPSTEPMSRDTALLAELMEQEVLAQMSARKDGVSSSILER